MYVQHKTCQHNNNNNNNNIAYSDSDKKRYKRADQNKQIGTSAARTCCRHAHQVAVAVAVASASGQRDGGAIVPGPIV